MNKIENKKNKTMDTVNSEPDDTFTPRNYQKELMEIALKKNTIIYLPTGSGKTFIAILVLKQMSQCLLKSYSNGGKVSVFLVNTVALAYQNSKYIRDHTVLTTSCHTGELDVDSWEKDFWISEFNKYQVLVMTSQIFYNLLINAYIDLNKVNLLIFDECHRGVFDHSMRLIMKSFVNYVDPPRVLGLTATLLNGNCKISKIMDEVKELEITYQSQVATIDCLEYVVGFSTNPQEKFKIFNTYNLNENDIYSIKILENLIYFLENINIDNTIDKIPLTMIAHLLPLIPEDGLKKLKNLIKDLIIHIEMLGTCGGYYAVIAHMIQIERLRKHCQHINLFKILNYVLTVCGCVKTLFHNTMKDCDKSNRIFQFSSDKVLKFIEILKDYSDYSNEELCALVFTQRRFTAKILNHLLQSSDKLKFIKSNFIVGNNNSPHNVNSIENLFISKKNREVLEDFVSKEINVLVCSNVLEEGVDIPKCTLVIKFDKSEDYRSYIQSKGRARQKNSLYYTLVEHDIENQYEKKYKEFQKIENILNDYLIGKNQERSESVLEDNTDRLLSECDIPPYCPNGTNSGQVNMFTSISLLSHYCNCLPCDQYTNYAPDWYIETEYIKGRIQYRVIIILPTICPLIEPIYGPFLPTKREAKRAAALYACIKLHECGELTYDLKPHKHTIDTNDINISGLFKHWPNDDKKFISEKRKRLHKNKPSKYLINYAPLSEKFYLHIINLKLLFQKKNNLYEEVFYDLYTSDLCYGFLTPHKLPIICPFPLYISDGSIMVHIKSNIKQIELDNNDLTNIKNFHYLIFKDFLELLKSFLIYDVTSNSEIMLIVPVNNKTNEINFNIIKTAFIRTKQDALSINERINIDVNDETFLYKVVSPWYRAQPQMYIVTKILYDKNPLSKFPNEEFKTFLEYYCDKHGQYIHNRNQPLLLVKSISNRINFIKPKNYDTNNKRMKRYLETEEFLIPELVIKQEFPSCLWLQGRLLPSIITRIIYLLKLKQLKQLIIDEANFIDDNIINEPPLELDECLLNFQQVNDVLTNEEPKELTKDNVLKISTLRQLNKDYTNKLLEAEYPWKNIDEPKDLLRYIDVTVMDIEHYEVFMNEVYKRDGDQIKKYPMNNINKNNLPALTYPVEYCEKPLKMLDKTSDTNKAPTLAEFYRSLTTSEAVDIVNLERLETLGDSCLKLIATLFIMFKFPKYNEGQAANLKDKLISNKNLYYLGVNKHFGGILKCNDFLPNEQWVPPGFTVPPLLLNRIMKNEVSVNCLFYYSLSKVECIQGAVSNSTTSQIIKEDYQISSDEKNSYNTMYQFINSQYVNDKSISDTVEALIGAFFQSSGLSGAIKFIEWIGIIPKKENLKCLIENFPSNPFIKKDNFKNNCVDIHIPNWEKFEEIFGYKFNNRGYLLQALTHPSYSPNRFTHNYECLEFIGDAILDFLITCYIFEYCGNLTPGQVTDLRSALVNNNTFASLTVRCGFHKFLLLINHKLQGFIDKFVDYLVSKNYVIDDEVLILLEEQDFNIADYIDVPKVLGDLFEALAGAVYLDSGKDLNVVWKVFYKIMWKEIDLFSKNVPINIVRKLYECPNTYPIFSKAVKLDNRTMLSLEFMCDGRKKIVHGFGSNKNTAKRAAAKIALRSLKL